MTRQTIPCGKHVLTWSPGHPLVMGIVNLTPDSFSGDGLMCQTEQAYRQAMTLLESGADLIDLGAESTRPGAASVPAEEELARLMPLCARLLAAGVPFSVDTQKAVVMDEAIRCGAGMINDVSALTNPMAISVVAPHTAVSVCLMHRQGESAMMQEAPAYDDVQSEVTNFLRAAIVRAENGGIAPTRILLDPGFGFGKNLVHNQQLFQALSQLVALGFPVLVGVSRKSMIGQIIDRPVDQRLVGSVAAAMLAAQYGAAVIRVHDVPQTVDALKIFRALGPQH